MKSEAPPGSPGDAITETATGTRHRAGACLNPNGDGAATDHAAHGWLS